MPVYRRRRATRLRRRKGRRSYKRSRFAYTARPQRMSSATCIPPSMDVNLKYTDQYQFPTGVPIVLSTRTFCLNDCFDPNVSGVGAQPTGFDQWTAFYSRWCVTSCFVKLEFMNLSPLNIVETVMYPSQNGAILTTTLDAASQPRSKRGLTVGAASTAVSRMSRKYSIPFEIGRPIYDTQYCGTASIGPSVRVFLNVIIAALDGVTSMAGSIYRIDMTFKVHFFSPNNLLLS